MTPIFFGRQLRLFGTVAVLILCIVFFLVPFALRGARLSLERMKNDVKDWLPADFPETAELTWFGEHFVGERFVLMTWPGCTAVDPRFQLLVEKLSHEIAPPVVNRQDAGNISEAERARRVGDEYGLHIAGDLFPDWGGREEKWLKGDNDSWYFITPDGALYRWTGRSNLGGFLWRTARGLMGQVRAEGELVARLGAPSEGGEINPYYDNPRKLTARFFSSVTTGPEALERLASEGGPLWPIGNYSEEEKRLLARGRALERLTGTLFGPAVPEDFAWTVEAVREHLPQAYVDELPSNWPTQFETYIDQVAAERFDGNVAALVEAPVDVQGDVWRAFFLETLEIAPPPRQTCVVVTLSEAGTRNLQQVVGRPILGKPRGKLLELASGECGIPPDQLKLGGPPVDNVAIDEEGTITLFRLIWFSVAVGLGLSMLCFRSVKITIMVFFCGGVSAVASLSIVWWTGASVDAVLMSMPSLIYVLGLSGAVHIINYYREAVEERGVDGAPERAVRHGWWPCTLAAFTTALGLLSLYTSNILPIRKFGLYSAIGVMATLTLLFTYLPAALQTWPPGYRKRGRREEGSTDLVQQSLLSFWERIGGWVVHRHLWVSGVCSLVCIALGWGLKDIDTSVQLLKMFDEDSKIIQDYAWLEDHFGKLVPMELVVRVDPDRQRPPWVAEADSSVDRQQALLQYSLLERMEIAERVQSVVEREFGETGQQIVGRGMSAATFAPVMPEPSYGSFRSPRYVLNRKLEQNRDELLQSDYVRVDRATDEELWRISLRVGALSDVDYGQFVSQLKSAVEPILAAYAYRDRILNVLLHEEDEGRLVGSRVYLLGVDNPTADTGVEGAPAEPVSENAGAQDVAAIPAERQTQIFAETLRDLLINRGLGRSMQFQDPENFPEGLSTSEEWAAQLKQFDVVVLAQNAPVYDLDFIREHAKQFVDARDHRFVAGSSPTAAEQEHPVDVVYTGVVPVVYKAQRTLLNSLINSIGLAFVMIAAVMACLLRSGPGIIWYGPLPLPNLINLRGGMVSMIPNVFPVIVVFGAMGHLRILVDIGSMMTASVAMGVAVDDTIHFLTWFRDGLRSGLSRNESILLAYRRCAAAMTQTTLIGGLGLAVFALSTFTPTQRFGTLMLTLLVAAIVGDLIFLPALLAGPLGKYLERRESKMGPPADEMRSLDGVEEAQSPRAVAPPTRHSALNRFSISRRRTSS